MGQSTWGLQLQVVSKPTCTKPPAFYFLSPVFQMSSAKGGLPTHLHQPLHHHPSIQLLHLFRTTTRTLGRPTWGGYGGNKDPYCHKIATTFPERSKLRCARPMSTGTARSSPTSSPSQSRSKIATSSPRRSASLK